MGAGSSRNRKCPCGSGKKVKQCCDGRKPRNTIVAFEFAEPVAVTGVTLFPDGTFAPLADGKPVVPTRASVEKTYERVKGPKVLNRVPLSPAALAHDINQPLTEKFRLFAVDTNSRKIGNDVVSATCVTMCEFISRDGASIARFAPIKCVEFRNAEGSIENGAWCTAIEMIRQNPAYRPDLKFGIVVDSDLSSIPTFNAREKPLYGEFYLPEGFELIYASSDAGKEYIPNLLISRSDSEAKRLLLQIEANRGINSDLIPSPILRASGMRLWSVVE